MSYLNYFQNVILAHKIVLVVIDHVYASNHRCGIQGVIYIIMIIIFSMRGHTCTAIWGVFYAVCVNI